MENVDAPGKDLDRFRKRAPASLGVLSHWRASRANSFLVSGLIRMFNAANFMR
jgi:hypothetical protein